MYIADSHFGGLCWILAQKVAHCWSNLKTYIAMLGHSWSVGQNCFPGAAIGPGKTDTCMCYLGWHLMHITRVFLCKCRSKIGYQTKTWHKGTFFFLRSIPKGLHMTHKNAYLPIFSHLVTLTFDPQIFNNAAPISPFNWQKFLPTFFLLIFGHVVTLPFDHWTTNFQKH